MNYVSNVQSCFFQISMVCTKRTAREITVCNIEYFLLTLKIHRRMFMKNI